MSNLPTFESKYNELRQRASSARDWQSPLFDTLTSYNGGLMFAHQDGDIEFSKAAASQLFSKIGLPVATIGAFDDAPEIQKAMVAHRFDTAKGTGLQDQTLLLRGGESRTGSIRIQSVLSEQYFPVSNGQILDAVMQAITQERIEPLIHKAQIGSTRMMALRLVMPEWTYELGPTGGTAYTGLSILNDEMGRSSLSVKAAVAKVSCFNWTVGDYPLFEHEHRWLTPVQVFEGILNAFASMQRVSGEIAAQLTSFHGTDVEDVKGMLANMGQSLNMPGYAVQDAQQWWEDNGSVPTLFWVVQALGFAADSVTSRKGFRWELREHIERQSLNLATTFQETGKMELCQCPRCHRPLTVETIDAGADDYVIS
jgi:hypothetical protein